MNANLMNSPFALELLNEIKEAYILFTSSLQQPLSFQELKAIFKAFGINLKSAQLKLILQQKFNQDVPQELTFDQTIDILLPYLVENSNSQEQLERVFNIFDTEKKNLITFNNLVKIAKEIGENVSEQELYEMFKIADKDQDGVLNKDEFFKIMRTNQDDDSSDEEILKPQNQIQQKQVFNASQSFAQQNNQFTSFKQ